MWLHSDTMLYTNFGLQFGNVGDFCWHYCGSRALTVIFQQSSADSSGQRRLIYWGWMRYYLIYDTMAWWWNGWDVRQTVKRSQVRLPVVSLSSTNELGTCESEIFVRIESRIELAATIRIESGCSCFFVQCRCHGRCVGLLRTTGNYPTACNIARSLLKC